MNASSGYDIINIPLNWKEENHQSIDRIEFHVFCRDCFQFQNYIRRSSERACCSHVVKSEGVTSDEYSVYFFYT